MRINSKIIFLVFIFFEKFNCGGVEEIEKDSKYNDLYYLYAYKSPINRNDF